MADTVRHRWGESGPIEARVINAQAIELGNMLIQTGGFIAPISILAAAV